MFTKHEQADAFTVEVTVRNFKPVAPFVVRWQYPLMRPDESLDPARLKLAGGRPKRHTVEALLRLLGDQSLSTVEWQKHAQTESGMPEHFLLPFTGSPKTRSGHSKQRKQQMAKGLQ